MVNREDVVSYPYHVWLIASDKPLDFIDDESGIAASVRLAEDLMAAPAALVRTSAGGNERGGAFAVSGAPGIHVTIDVNGVARWPGLSVEVRNL
jgi:hypothetical protein